MESYFGSVIAWAGGFLFLALAFLLIPFVIALIRGHRYKWVILVLCVLGIFGVPWFVAFIWSVWPSQSSLAEPVLGNPTGTGTRNIGDTLGAVDAGKFRGRAAEQRGLPGESPTGRAAFTSKKLKISGFDSAGRPISFSLDLSKRQGEKILIGRNANDCEFLIDDTSVSRRHAEISVQEEGAFIRDLNSANGTRMNAQRVAEVPIEVPPRGRISLGAVALDFDIS